MPLISAATKANMTSLLNQLISDFSKECTLEYPGVFIPCQNPIHGQLDQNANYYLSGGRVSSLGECADCGGSGKVMSAVTEAIQCTAEIIQKPYIKSGNIDVRVPDSSLLTRGPLADLPKVRRANKLTYNGMDFTLFREPSDINNFFGGNLYEAIWERT